MIRPSICILIGLGFSVGFLIGTNEGIFPGSKDTDPQELASAENRSLRPVEEGESVRQPKQQEGAQPFHWATMSPVIWGLLIFLGSLAALVGFWKPPEMDADILKMRRNFDEQFEDAKNSNDAEKQLRIFEPSSLNPSLYSPERNDGSGGSNNSSSSDSNPAKPVEIEDEIESQILSIESPIQEPS